MCGQFDFQFPISTSSSKNFFKCTTFNFQFISVHILEIKESGTCQKRFSKGTISYTFLLLDLISYQLKVYFKLIDVREYQCNAYLHLLLLLLTLKVPLWWTPFKQFFLNIILTHVTKKLRILYLWLSILGGVDVHFIQEPSNPSYFNNGSDANLVWDYTDPHNKVQNIIYSVHEGDKFVRAMVNGSHSVQEHPDIPPSYKGRVKIEGRATLVIKNINPGDNTKFKCGLFGSFVGEIQSTVQLIVTGTYYRYF